MKMKRFLLFVGETYYPRGGSLDLVGDFDTVDEAKSNAKEDWWNVLDTETGAFHDESHTTHWRLRGLYEEQIAMILEPEPIRVKTKSRKYVAWLLAGYGLAVRDDGPHRSGYDKLKSITLTGEARELARLHRSVVGDGETWRS